MIDIVLFIHLELINKSANNNNNNNNKYLNEEFTADWYVTEYFKSYLSNQFSKKNWLCELFNLFRTEIK